MRGMAATIPVAVSTMVAVATPPAATVIAMAAEIKSKPEGWAVTVVAGPTVVARAVVTAIVVSGPAVIRLAVIRITGVAIPAHVAITWTINAAAEHTQQ